MPDDTSPNALLARRIAIALATDGLIAGSISEVLALRIAEGSVRAEDWEGIIVDPPVTPQRAV